MLATFLTVLPIFALILAGWVARRLGVLGAHATTELNRFVVYLALPALLFDIVAHAHWIDVWQPAFIAAFGGSCLIVFVLTIIVGLAGRRRLADAAIDALNASYPNAGFMGFPIALALFGAQSLPLTMVASLITVCVLFAFTIVLVEISLQVDSHAPRVVAKVAMSLLRNPLIIAPIIATAIPMTHWTVPAPAETFLKLLGAAASPCALVALGLFLADPQTSREAAGQSSLVRPVGSLVFAKLILHPVITWGLAVACRLPSTMTHIAVLLAALPTGTGPFMIAELYDREARVTSNTILITTLLSVLTLALYLQLIGH